MTPIASSPSWEVGTVSVTSNVVTGGAAGRWGCTTGTGTSTGTTGGGARRAAAIAGSIMVQASAGGVLVVVMPQPADTIYTNVNPVWEFFKFSVEALH